LALRIPAWAEGATVNGKPVDAGQYARVEQTWSPGDTVEVQLPLTPRTVTAAPRVDAVRGCVAIERGPLVYAVEQVDQDANVDDLHLVEAAITAHHEPDLLGGVTELTTQGRVDSPTEIKAVPYYAWANREIGAMRVWLPRG
jgi:DUF1680 family protein